MGRLQDRVAVITGAGDGIGHGIARRFAAEGAKVLVAELNEKSGRAVAAELADEFGTDAFFVHTDVSDHAQVRAMVDAAVDRWGTIDILVNNAWGGGGIGRVENKTDELFEQTIRTNLLGTWFCCRTVGERMLRDGKGGSLINISSIMGVAGGQNTPTAYHSSKAAVINLTRSLAISWADRGVRVNAIAPGWFPSEMTAGWFALPVFRERLERGPPPGVCEGCAIYAGRF